MAGTTRRDFAGTGKAWFEGTLFSEAAQISATIGGQTNRVVTTGYTGETIEDPTKCEIRFEGSILKRDSYLRKLTQWRKAQRDVTCKVQIGADVIIARGKLGPLEVRTENGKTTFSTSFMGDEQG